MPAVALPFAALAVALCVVGFLAVAIAWGAAAARESTDSLPKGRRKHATALLIDGNPDMRGVKVI